MAEVTRNAGSQMKGASATNRFAGENCRNGVGIDSTATATTLISKPRPKQFHSQMRSRGALPAKTSHGQRQQAAQHRNFGPPKSSARLDQDAKALIADERAAPVGEGERHRWAAAPGPARRPVLHEGAWL